MMRKLVHPGFFWLARTLSWQSQLAAVLFFYVPLSQSKSLIYRYAAYRVLQWYIVLK